MVLKECQDELGCIDLAVWILLIHRHTEFCPLLSVFYIIDLNVERKKKRGDREEEGRHEKKQIFQANQTLNLPPPTVRN